MSRYTGVPVYFLLDLLVVYLFSSEKKEIVILVTRSGTF